MIKIRGVVKLASTIRQKLQNGIPEGEAAAFRDQVRQNVALIENLCRRAGKTPKSLPLPSRQAYHFLKGLDLKALPLCRDAEAVSPPRRLRIHNLVKSSDALVGWISEAASNPASGSTVREQIARRLRGEVEAIERLCADSGASPRDLAGPSRRAFGWMKFLTRKDHLERHLETVARGTEILRRVSSDRGLGSRKPSFHLANLSGIFRGKTSPDAIAVQANEGFLGAEDEVLEAIVRCVLEGKDRQRLKRIEQFADSETYGETVFEVEAAAGPNDSNGQGRHYDLRALFEKVNAERFRGEMERPELTWSRTFTSCKFGHYHATRDVVMVSLTLDDARVPSFVVEFVLYHELLHKKLGVRWRGATRRAHTGEFRQEEMKFPRWKEADAWLTRLATDIRKGRSSG